MKIIVPQLALTVISQNEGGRSADGLYHAYWDPYGRVWTIGHGWTHGVTPGMVWTEKQADDNLRERIVDGGFLEPIEDLDVDLNIFQIASLLDFDWNLGPGSIAWIAPYLRRRDFKAAADAMLNFDHANGVVLPGLVHRREIDHDLLLRQPQHVPTFHYDWYPPHWRNAIKRYDALRAKPQLSAPERVLMRARERECSAFAASVSRKARRLRNAHDHPSWNVNHRGWSFQELRLRAEGKRVYPV